MNKQDTISGFAYPVEDNVWVISTEPHLKSCCIGKKDVGQQWWIVNPDKPLPQNRAISLQGILSEENGRTFLEKASLVQPNPANWGYIGIFGVCLFIVIWLIGRPRKTDADNRN